MHKLHLPRLGQTMQYGTILSWLKNEGEAFEVGELLYEVESEKAVLTVEAKLPGTLARIVAPLDEELPTGTLLAVVADPGETLLSAEIEAAIAEEQGSTSTTPATPLVSAVTPSLQAQPGMPVETHDVRVRVMPRARMLAEQRGIDLATIKGTGQDGTITLEDVQRANPVSSALSGPAVRERRPLRGIPRTMAEVVTSSWQQVPQFVQIVLVDATALRLCREAEALAIKQQYGFDLSYTDLILKAMVQSVREVPEVNASFMNEEIVIYEDINLSVAVNTDAGLVVPVIHHAQTYSLGEIMFQLREISRRARSSTLTREDVQNGTITLSNLGMLGVETGTPLVTLPQAATVFTGAIIDRPIAVNKAVEVHPTFYVSIAFDHRVVDGASAARFTATLKEKLETVQMTSFPFR